MRIHPEIATEMFYEYCRLGAKHPQLSHEKKVEFSYKLTRVMAIANTRLFMVQNMSIKL